MLPLFLSRPFYPYLSISLPPSLSPSLSLSLSLCVCASVCLSSVAGAILIAILFPNAGNRGRISFICFNRILVSRYAPRCIFSSPPPGPRPTPVTPGAASLSPHHPRNLYFCYYWKTSPPGALDENLFPRGVIPFPSLFLSISLPSSWPLSPLLSHRLILSLSSSIPPRNFCALPRAIVAH